MKKITDRVAAGNGSPGDIDTLYSVAKNIDGKTICAFGEACSWPTESFVEKFRHELVGSTDEDNAEKIFAPESVTAAAGLAGQ